MFHLALCIFWLQFFSSDKTVTCYCLIYILEERHKNKVRTEEVWIALPSEKYFWPAWQNNSNEDPTFDSNLLFKNGSDTYPETDCELEEDKSAN